MYCAEYLRYGVGLLFRSFYIYSYILYINTKRQPPMSNVQRRTSRLTSGSLQSNRTKTAQRWSSWWSGNGGGIFNLWSSMRALHNEYDEFPTNLYTSKMMVNEDGLFLSRRLLVCLHIRIVNDMRRLHDSRKFCPFVSKLNPSASINKKNHIKSEEYKRLALAYTQTSEEDYIFIVLCT